MQTCSFAPCEYTTAWGTVDPDPIHDVAESIVAMPTAELSFVLIVTMLGQPRAGHGHAKPRPHLGHGEPPHAGVVVPH